MGKHVKKNVKKKFLRTINHEMYLQKIKNIHDLFSMIKGII